MGIADDWVRELRARVRLGIREEDKPLVGSLMGTEGGSLVLGTTSTQSVVVCS